MLYWIIVFLGIVFSIILAGAVLGGFLFLIVGLLAGLEYPVTELLKNGIYDGGFLATIWAPGASFVVCVMLAHNRRKKQDTPT